MKILLDTNVFLDALQNRKPFAENSQEILMKAQDGEFTVSITANSVADIFYLYTKVEDMKTANRAVSFIVNQYSVISVTHSDCKRALQFDFEDFEDSLVYVCAEKEQIDYIVTRDKKVLKIENEVKVISPIDFLKIL